MMNFTQRKAPLLIGCSCTPESEELVDQLRSLGFVLYIEQPLQKDRVTQII